MRLFLTLLTFIMISTTMTANAEERIVRHKNPAHMTESWAREFAEAIEVTGTTSYLYLSGVGPRVADPSAPSGSIRSYGDTETQTRSVLEQIKQILGQKGYAMGDIISMQALLVADPNVGQRADFTAFSKVYNQYFGTPDQPDVPVRTRAQVLNLVPPGWLVEITVVAAKPGK